MPLTYFYCPDKTKIPTADCLNKCPRAEGRCLSLPTLYEIGKTRPWTGKPSTTQLLNPTRMEYLKINNDYSLDPRSMAFALLGTRHHYRLEQVAKTIEGLQPEMRVEAENTGILDLLEPINGAYRLIDYKTWGSYQVAKHLRQDNLHEYDRMQLALQLNDYRIMARKYGFNVTEIWVQVTVRDGGTFTARNNGVEDKMLFLPVEILEDSFVSDYFTAKHNALTIALAANKLPALCDYEERWAGRRCKIEFCNVAEFCPEGRKVNRIYDEYNQITGGYGGY